MGS
ncbi:hypothetical protein YPPY66_0545, partial [Yersinia pestis PY-66]|jgi:hypothetical protein